MSTRVISRDRVAVAVGAVCFAGIAVVVLTSGLHQSRLEIVFETACLLVWFAAMLLLSRKTASATYELADSRDVYQRALLQGQKLNALGKLAGSIENNFNNALMSIDYSLHLLSESLADSQLGPELDDMHQTVVRSKALSKKLERLGHGDAETIELVEVDVAVEALARSLRRLTGSSTLTLALGAPRSHILCDANQLDQVLVNLVVNSRDAMPGGGEITISTAVSDDHVMIAVRDCGGGIAPDVLEHIFEPFYTTKGPESGTGLGLWICSSIASGCGGTLTAESVVGQGTTMTLRLPLANRNARSSTTRAKVTSRPLQLARKTSACTQHPRAVDWFVGDIVNPRLRVWGVVLVMISLASVPIWALFAGLQLDAFGPTPIAITLLAGGVLSLVTPLLVRVTRSPELAAFSFAGVLSTAICAIAILSGGFRIEVLIWMTLIPILGAQQREFRYFTRFWSIVVVAQIAGVAILALAGAITLPAMAPAMLANERLAILLSLLAVLAFGFIAAARVGVHFARERDDYAATLVRSQDFQMLGTIASSIAHDLNNILTTLEFGIEIIRDEVAADAPAAAHLDELRMATARIQDLARQLTRFGRSNTDGANVVPDVALASLEKMLGPIVGSHIKVSMNLDAGSSTVRVRSCELDQLIINLALNARDAMPDGGELRISSAVIGNAVEITVSDRGIGIPQPLLARVCDPFFTTSDDRVGLGLWVCREIVHEAHGKLVVESTVGRGTTIRLIIPRVLARASDAIRRAQRSGGFSNPLPTAIELAKSATPSTRIRRET